ncbi:hypothetical protein CFP65_2487 [Kitasatospora sp. MMS16-BH015]|uniref:DUF2637 domain-containing protein n=1 Tax=Kitasatospora sp. MMS16-BH015 TaxID=2018025 RepID=UPI000CA0AAE9|nr:DUF2637 domain-containing protein [Kitasatospora sp. MMS16-BH015]AUG77319.1 hypothetical protein CFP65_2487 [Kitasatospora sp. MMS16-BH015]
MARPSLTRAHRALLGLVAAGACLISGIGFAGSYNAVRELAMEKGFGAFSYAFPIGVDAGIVVLLALDLVLTWLRIPFPLLRQTAWLLTAATIAFNAAASWGDALGMAMHAVIPVLFVVVVEASRHAVGRIAAITADRHMESVRLMRWVLSPVPTFRLWRRMKLWELRSYDETVRLEQNRLVYRAQLRFRYGRGWRRSAPFQALLPLKLAKYGVPLDPGILDRIDGPLEAAPTQATPPGASRSESRGLPQAAGAVGRQVQSGHAGLPTTGDQVPVDQAPVTAAVAVPTLAKLAAVRLRDAQEPSHEEEGAAAPAQPQPELNVWLARTQQEQAQHGYQSRVPGQASPWFKPPRVSRPGEQVSGGVPADGALTGGQGAGAPMAGAPVTAAPEHGMPAPVPAGAVPGGVRPRPVGPRPVRIEQLAPEGARQVVAVAEEDNEPYLGTEEAFAEAVALELEEEAAALNGESAEHRAAQQGVEHTASSHAEDRHPVAAPLDPEVCFAALVSYIDQYERQPDVAALAEYLTTEYGVVGTRPDGSVSPSELGRIWERLQRQYVASGRD